MNWRGSRIVGWVVLLCIILVLCIVGKFNGEQIAKLVVDMSEESSRSIPDHMFGISFEEINHAGAGGLWAELVSNRGFEAGGQHTPSNIYPWSIIGNESYIHVWTDLTSCFDRNKVALRMEVLCDDTGPIICPTTGVGVYNPGYWGMNIEEGKAYAVVLYVRSLESMNLSVSLTNSDGSKKLATAFILTDTQKKSEWSKVELLLEASGTDANSRLQLTTSKKGVIWLDQVSVMPQDTYMGHGFRNELLAMLEELKPRFLRFPGGSYVEGGWLRNAFRWRDTIGPWEERPGHFNDVWSYWTDDGLGYYEFLQLAEDIDASPVWVVNGGISHNDEVNPSKILPFVKDVLSGIEFARGDSESEWGSVRAKMGHSEPFELKYVAIGNQDCSKQSYRENYLKFYSAIKGSYPDINIISNCDGSSGSLDHPADLYDFHVYTSANNMFSMAHQFDQTPRNNGPKAFVSEYAVTGNDAGKGSFLAALAEAGFLIGLERNSDVVEMASNAPLFVNANDRSFNSDAIVFDSWRQYGTPSYWMQQFFKDSGGATLHPSDIQASSSNYLISSAITWQSSDDNSNYLKIKIVNYSNDRMNMKISIKGLQNGIDQSGCSWTVLTADRLNDENSFAQPNKIVPKMQQLTNAGAEMIVLIAAHSINSLDFLLAPEGYSDI